MKSLSKTLVFTVLVSTMLGNQTMAQEDVQGVRVKIDAKVNGEKTTIDTVIYDFDSFDLDAFLEEQGLGDDMEGLQTVDVRIMKDKDGGFDNSFLREFEENAFFDQMHFKVESIDMPEMPHLPATANVMFINGNRAFLGVITENTANGKGVLVKEVVEESAAAQAGLQQGDILTKVNDMTVESTNNLIEILGAFEPGDQVSISYLRNGSEQRSTVALKERENYFNSSEWEVYGEKWEQWGEAFGEHMEEWGREFENSFNQRFEMEEKAFLGVYLGDAEADNGVLITGVGEGSAAEEAGLRKDDIIIALDGNDMRTYSQVSEYVQSKEPGETIRVTVLRDGKEMDINATLKSRQTEVIIWSGEEEGQFRMPHRMMFFGPMGDCNSYTYELKDEDGKEITMEIDVVDEVNAKEENTFRAADVEFYPNPSTGTFNLKFEGGSQSDVLINILDMNGNMVYEEELSNFSGTYNKTIDLGNEAKGNYLINIVRGNYIVTKQIVVQ
jgi:membrane-associated protease RseP (regulator of RpoE activity)